MPRTHSPGPWAAQLGTYIIDAHGTLIATAEHGGPRKGERPTQANASRIVACVNACDGIDDPAAALAEVRRNLREFAETYAESAVGYDARRLLALLGSKP